MDALADVFFLKHMPWHVTNAGFPNLIDRTGISVTVQLTYGYTQTYIPILISVLNKGN